MQTHSFMAWGGIHAGYFDPQRINDSDKTLRINSGCGARIFSCFGLALQLTERQSNRMNGGQTVIPVPGPSLFNQETRKTGNIQSYSFSIRFHIFPHCQFPLAIMEEKNSHPIPDKNTINVALLSQEEADKLRSQALSSDRTTIPAGYYSSTRVVGTFVGIALSLVGTYFAYQAGAAVIISINEDIGPSANSSLFAIVWTAAQPISILLFGSLSDRFGRRKWALAANMLGIVGGIVAGTAKTMNTLIGAMVMLGLASGVPASYPLLTGELATNKGKFLATITVVVPNIIATGFGPYIGQRLVVYATWRWIFWIYIMMMGE